MQYEAWRNLPQMFFEQAARLGDRPFLWSKRDGAYLPLGYAETALLVNRFARGLRALGLRPGDRVVLVSENRPEWLVADLAIMAAGGVTVPAFTTNTAADHQYVLTHSGARGAVISGRAIARRLLPAALEAPDLGFLVSLEDLDLAQRPAIDVRSWSDVVARGIERPDDVAATIADLAREEPCCIIYTSGTGGTPKGVMLSHGAILANCRGAHDVLADFGLGDEVFLSFLPLSHSYEHTAGQFFPISIGAQIYYAESIERLTDNMAEARPTIMTAVPRLYEAMHQRIMRSTERTHGLRKRLFLAACALGRQKYERPGTLTLGQRLLDLVVEALVRRRVRRRFGGRLKALVSGGAALNYEIGLFFTALGLRILQGYGQTEAAPIITVNPPARVKLHAVGPPLHGVELRIAADGEILAKGPNIATRGYFKQPDATKEVFEADGWFHTGDIGRIDEDGFVFITDRKKDLIVTAGGMNIAPQNVENLLKADPFISQVMVYGDRRPYPVALITINPEELQKFAHEQGILATDAAVIVKHPKIVERIGRTVEEKNTQLQSYAKIKKFTVLPTDFTLDGGELTPTLKVKRKVVAQKYMDAIEELYR